MSRIKGRKVHLDVLNILACISVIYLHVNGAAFWNFSYDEYWFSGVVIESLFYFAVPIFIMITGINLIDYNERDSLKIYFRKRIVKTVIPFLFWSLVFLIRKESWAELLQVKETIDLILNTRVEPVYWFFIPLFAAYLSIPVLSEIPKANRKKIFGYIAIIGIIFISILPGIFALLNVPYNYQLTMIVAEGFLLYVVLGYWIENYKLANKYKYIIYALGVVGLLIHLFGTYYLSIASGRINGMMKGYMNFPTLFYSLAIFYSIKSISFDGLSKEFSTYLSKMSSCSLGIYLIHMYIIHCAFKYLEFDKLNLTTRVFLPLLIYVVCLIIVFYVRKIPVIKKVFP